MRKTSLNANGFGLAGILIIVAALVVVGSSGVYVYHHNHKAKAAMVDSSTSKTTTTTKTPTPTDPYAGWKTASLKYEQATFKYPASWQISNTSKTEAETGGTATPGADSVSLTSPTGLIVSIITGQPYNVDEAGMASVLPGAQPIQTLGGTYYLDFYNSTDSTTPTDAVGACLDKSATTSGNEAPYITSKNIQIVSNTNSPAADLVCIQYRDAKGNLIAKSVSTFQQDSSYSDAKLIVESLSY